MSYNINDEGSKYSLGTEVTLNRLSATLRPHYAIYNSITSGMIHHLTQAYTYTHTRVQCSLASVGNYGKEVYIFTRVYHHWFSLNSLISAQYIYW